MAHVAGIDSSTQSTKVTVYDADDGTLIRHESAPHPDGTAVDPQAWWEALTTAGDGLLDGVEAVSVAAQQHGMVLVDDAGAVVHDALLWNDTRSAPDAAELTEELGGPQAWADAVGLVPVASFTVTKIRWVARNAPDAAARAAGVMLPHDWLSWRLAGGPGSGAEPVTDRGDASGTGYWSPITGSYRDDLMELAFGRVLQVPRVAGPSEVIGRTASGAAIAPGTGDNMGAGLGLGLQPGDAVVSIGTSGTVFAVAEAPTKDPKGDVAGFCDATGRFLPLVCTLNAARVLEASAKLLGVSLAEHDELALSAPAGAGGLTFVPYLDGERTPNLPDATGSLHGMTRANMTPATMARAAVEGMLCSLADGIDALRDLGVDIKRVLIVGGGTKSRAVQQFAPDIFGVPVVVPDPQEYVARGAARQAAWALKGGAEAPEWPLGVVASNDPSGGDGGARERYAAAAATYRA